MARVGRVRACVCVCVCVCVCRAGHAEPKACTARAGVPSALAPAEAVAAAARCGRPFGCKALVVRRWRCVAGLAPVVGSWTAQQPAVYM
jgi:hypothetical protein